MLDYSDITPEAIASGVDEAITRAGDLLDRVVDPETPPGFDTVMRPLDQISDIMSGQPPRPPKPVPTPAPGTTIGPGTVGGTAPSTNPAKSGLDG